MRFAEYESPCGRLMLGVYGPGLFMCDWVTGGRIESSLHRIGKYLREREIHDDEMLLSRVVSMLDEYFAGKRKIFEIPTITFGTEFQRRVWDELPKVSYGETSTYSAIATAVDNPRGVRAVAAAIGTNPLSILIPCHRIMGADGSLTGYAGGIEAKRYLLRLERHYLDCQG